MPKTLMVRGLTTDNEIKSSPAIGDDGRVYVPKFYGIDVEDD